MAYRGNKYFKKQKGRRAGPHPYTADDMKRASWCHTKDIFIDTPTYYFKLMQKPFKSNKI